MFAPKKKTGLLITLIALLLAPVSNAQQLPLATGEWVPITSAAMDGYGEFTRSVTTVLKEMGIEPKYHFYPWRRCFDAVVKGRAWAAFPYSYTQEREKKVWYSDPLSCSKTVFFYYDGGKAPKRFIFSNLEDLKPYRVGGVTGYFYEEAFKDAGLNVDYVNKEINAIEKLKMGRIDLMPVNERVGWNLIKTHFPNEADKFKTIAKPLDMNALHLIVSKEYPEAKKLLERFNQALKNCMKKGSIKIEQCQ